MRPKKSDYSRRKFLATSAAGLVTAGLTGLAPNVSLSQETDVSKNSADDKMISRTLGRTGIELPIVSMGLGNCREAALIEDSFNMGIRHFDTAANYQFGANEQLLGSVVKKMGIRDDVVIGTKVYTPQQRRNREKKYVVKKLTELTEGSLKRLKTDYTDILYVHDVDSKDLISDPVIVEAMKSLKKQGKARAIGFSTHSNMAEILEEAARTGDWDVILFAINFTLSEDTPYLNAIEEATRKGIGLIGMKTMAGGSRWPNPESRADYSHETVISAINKWVLRNENITTIIPAYDNRDHMRINISFGKNLVYTEEEKKFLSDNNIKQSLGFCRQCRSCLASCPNGAEIPTLMRTHMYAAQYSNFYLARETYDEIANGKNIRACTSCHECTAKCQNSVDIGRRIRELKAIYA